MALQTNISSISSGCGRTEDKCHTCTKPCPLADLTDLSAMTETHGALTAAAVQKYIHLAHQSLASSSRLPERVGDQLMIIAEKPDDLACTALHLPEHTGSASNFLSVHGGLHYGMAIEQSGSYFGTSMNLTTRIAARAKSIACSFRQHSPALLKISTVLFLPGVKRYASGISNPLYRYQC